MPYITFVGDHKTQAQDHRAGHIFNTFSPIETTSGDAHQTGQVTSKERILEHAVNTGEQHQQTARCENLAKLAEQKAY